MHQRWLIEAGYRECKTYLRGPGRILRGRTPALARQELWAYLAVYQAIRAIIVRAAAGAGLDPDQISFTAALHAARRTLGSRDQAAALAATQTEILTSLIPPRQGRLCARAVNKPSSPYPSKRNHNGPLSQHVTCTATITTLRDWRAYPAAELAACYAWRWAIETGYRECKTYLRGPGRVLRGRTPGLARQELWAYLAVYQAIRAIIVRAAAGAGIDPDQISFTAALHAVQRTLHASRDQAAALDAAETEILACLIPPRQGRICPRAVNKPSSPWPSKHNHTGPLSQHASYTTTITAPAPRTQTITNQPEHSGNHENQPP